MKKEKRMCKSSSKIFLISVVLMAVFLSAQYLYVDICETTAGGLNVWYSLFDGHLTDFYAYYYPGVSHSYIQDGIVGGAYDFAIYLIFALYNFPVWMWEKVTGLSVFEVYATKVYIKSITWAASALAGYLLYKICLECDVKKENAKWSVFLFFSSQLFFLSEVVTGGYDIISVVFTLIGIYGYLKNDDSCFYWSFAFAFSMKMFALWIFIPLLLLKEKKIGMLFIRMLQVLSVAILPKVLFWVVNNYTMTVHAAEIRHMVSDSRRATNDVIAHSDLVNSLLFPGLEKPAPIMIEGLPLVIVGMLMLWLFCWFNDKLFSKKQIIYICALAMSIFFLSARTHPYWAILLIPYIILLITFHIEHYKKNMFLESMFSIGYTIYAVLRFSWCVGFNLNIYMCKPDWVASPGERIQYGDVGLIQFFESLQHIVGIDFDNFAKIANAFFVTGLLYFLIINYIWCKTPEKGNGFEADNKFRIFMIVRVVIAILIGLIPMTGWYYIYR